MNRGSDHANSEVDIRCLASMRPRFMNRGSYTGTIRPARISLRFNEAPIHESGKSER